jgi:cytochrome c oxidase assembly protein subunit 15
MLHTFARFVAICTVFLVLAGSLVTSTGSGLAVPDWPTSYGWNMFTFPPAMWVGGIFYEHGHRLIASAVGFLTIVLAAWLWRVEPRRWVKHLGVLALGAVILQGLLGGLTVLFFLPAPVSTAHAGLAEIFFCMTVAIALFTSPRWIRAAGAVDDAQLRRVATATTALIYTQILIGAAMRHTGAGLAIPDFPWMFGRLVPDHWSPAIAVHFAHRLGALIVTTAILATSAHVWYHHRRRGELTRPATLLVALVAVQVTLGALTVLTRRDVAVNSAHVVCGALVLATSLVLTLRSWRVKFTRETVRLKPDTTPVTTNPVATPVVRSVRLPPSREASADRRSLGVGGQADRGGAAADPGRAQADQGACA